MAIRVVARIRPQQEHESDRDTIVSVASIDDEPSTQPTLIRIPNPKNNAEHFSFSFSSVYDQFAKQQPIFYHEVAPTIKHLFNGFDVTIFAYGSTGTGKTHTMRGGKTLAERGIIPRLLSGIYRRCRKIEKDSDGEKSAEISLSYYEIYNDKVFDLFEAPENRTMAGLPLRDNGSKTVVVGLTERPCETLKEFEKLYNQANVNRSTSATKLNANSSRSHAILSIKLAITTGEEIRVSTTSAIDLAGSEDNRRTDNGRERLVESSSINKSLFVLAKCVEAINQQQRIPYRESKMTRILSLGQNNGMTVMVLNLAPVRSYHLDTLSSLNFANRTKKIHVKEIENEPMFKGPARAMLTLAGGSIQRQPLRPLASIAHNAPTHNANLASHHAGKPPKTFSVYSDSKRHSNASALSAIADSRNRSTPLKRPAESFSTNASRPSKRRSPIQPSRSRPVVSKEAIEDMIERKVTDILAARALDQPSIAVVPEITEEVQRRLEILEQKIERKEDGREQGLTFLLMAKQHSVRGEDTSALRMYSLATEYFPDNAKLNNKIERLRAKLKDKKQQEDHRVQTEDGKQAILPSANVASIVIQRPQKTRRSSQHHDEENEGPPKSTSDADFEVKESCWYGPTSKKGTNVLQRRPALDIFHDDTSTVALTTPRTQRLLEIVNTRDITKIRQLKGVGAKKAEAIIESLCARADDADNVIHSLDQLGRLKSVGTKTVENMRSGLQLSSPK